MMHCAAILLWILRVTAATTWRNCEEWRLHGHTKSATFNVDPGRDGNLLSVYCDMTSIPAQTVFNHDVIARTHLGFSINGWYGIVIPTYDVTMNDVERVMTLTSSCQQYIKYECNTSKLILQPTYSKWESRDSVMQYYWGDANLQSSYCACGLSGSCANPSKKCNCLSEDATLREDSGYLTDSSVLPVTRVVIRMSKKASEGYFTLGPLTCVDVDPRSFIETPGGITTAIVCSVLFLILVFMITYACYKRRPWRKCGKCCRRRSINKLEKLPPQEKSDEIPEVSKISEVEEMSSSMAELPRGPLHAIMPPSWNVHNFPIQDYKPGELAKLLGAQNEVELARLRMQLNTKPYHPPPTYENYRQDSKEIVEPQKDTPENASKNSTSFDQSVNFDGVLLVRSLIRREQAERQGNAKHPQPQQQPSNTVVDYSNTVENYSNMNNARQNQSAVTISNLEESSIGDKAFKPDQQTENSEERHDVNVRQSHQVNHTNVQMVKNIIEQEKSEKGSFLSTDQHQPKLDSSPKASDQAHIPQRSFDAQGTENNVDWD